MAGVDDLLYNLGEFLCLSEPKQPADANAVEVAPYHAPDEAGRIRMDLHFKAATRDDGALRARS